MESKHQAEIPDYSFLAKSEKYQEGLERARESRDRQEAKLFRMEVMLDNAKLTCLLFDLIEENPQASIEELRLAVEQSDLVAHPAIVESFITNLVYNRKRVGQIVDRYSERAKQEGVSLGHLIFKNLLRQYIIGGGPNGRVFFDNSYPLALTLYIEEEKDFRQVDRRKNVGGFYAHEQSAKDTSFAYPFICILGLPPDFAKTLPDAQYDPTGWMNTKIVADHEEGHSKNRIVLNGLNEKPTKEELIESGGMLQHRSRRKAVWGGLSLKKISQYYNKETEENDVDELSRIFETRGVAEAKRSPIWHHFLEYSLGMAKDELLADYRGKTKYPFSHLDKLKKRGDLYDYFAKHLSLSESSELYSALWQEYENILESNVAAARNIVQIYQKFGLAERLDLFRWVLAQIPLDQWQKSLGNSLFEVEAYALEDVFLNYRNQTIDNGCFDKLKLYFRQHQTEPLLPYIEKLESGLEFDKVTQDRR